MEFNPDKFYKDVDEDEKKYYELIKDIRAEDAAHMLLEYGYIKDEETMYKAIKSNSTFHMVKAACFNNSAEPKIFQVVSLNRAFGDKLLSVIIENTELPFQYLDTFVRKFDFFADLEKNTQDFCDYQLLRDNIDEILRTAQHFQNKSVFLDFLSYIRNAVRYMKYHKCDKEEREQLIEKLKWFDERFDLMFENVDGSVSDLAFIKKVAQYASTLNDSALDPMSEEELLEYSKLEFPMPKLSFCEEDREVMKVENVMYYIQNVNEEQSYYYLKDEKVFMDATHFDKDHYDENKLKNAFIIDDDFVQQIDLYKRFYDKIQYSGIHSFVYKKYLENQTIRSYEQVFSELNLTDRFHAYLDEMHRILAIGWCLKHNFQPSDTRVQWDIITDLVK